MLMRWCIAIVLLGLSGGALAAAGETARGGSRLVSANEALVLLHREARDASRGESPWPTDRCDFAQRHGLHARGEDVGRLLGRRLHREASLDAYLKWQLLSFGPDLSQQPPDTVRRMLAALPPLTRYPRPWEPQVREEDFDSPLTRRGASRIRRLPAAPAPPADAEGADAARRAGLESVEDAATATTAPPPDPHLVALAVARANAVLEARHRQAAHANAPNLALRDDLVARLPEAGGLRLRAMIADVRQRLEAGDPSAAAALERLAAECQRLPEAAPAGAALPAPMRHAMANQVRGLGAVRTPVVTTFHVAPDEPPAFDADQADRDESSEGLEVVVVRAATAPIEVVMHIVALPAAPLEAAVVALQGRDARFAPPAEQDGQQEVVPVEEE